VVTANRELAKSESFWLALAKKILDKMNVLGEFKIKKSLAAWATTPTININTK
jgi:hypothetical protein